VTTPSGGFARFSPSPNLGDRNLGDGIAAGEFNLAVTGQKDAKQARPTCRQGRPPEVVPALSHLASKGSLAVLGCFDNPLILLKQASAAG
jgi:hypothetical protein